MLTCPQCHKVNQVRAARCTKCNADLRGVERDTRTGDVINGSFRLEKLLGAGATGKVYRAKQLRLDKDVAVKILHPHLHGDRAGASRFHREALAASRLNHPNCIKVLEFGQSGDDLFIAMEFLDGRALDEVVADEFPLAHSRVVELMAQACDALEEAHGQGIIHRDLKLENMMVVSNRGGREVVKVLDFGIAKIQKQEGPSIATVTQAGHVAGTPEYMSPEQARGETLDARADLYSLGVCLFMLVTGRLPYPGETPLAVVTQHLCDEIPVPSEVRPDLNILPQIDYLVLDCMAKDREDRPETATELGQRLRRLKPVLSGIDLWASDGEPSASDTAGRNYHDDVVVSYEPNADAEFLSEPTVVASESGMDSYAGDFSGEATAIVLADEVVPPTDQQLFDAYPTDPHVISRQAYDEPALVITGNSDPDDEEATFVGTMEVEDTDRHSEVSYRDMDATGVTKPRPDRRKLFLIITLVVVLLAVLSAMGVLALMFLIR